MQRIQAHQLSQHRMRTFKLSTDPKFAETCPARRRKVIEVARNVRYNGPEHDISTGPEGV